MNVIFLDVDGVLNSIKKLIEIYEITQQPHSGLNYPFDENCLNNLKDIVIETNSKIVISSTWKKNPESLKLLYKKLDEYDLYKYVIGITPNNKNRELEIKEYLDNYTDIDNFIIIDDEANLKELSDHLIKTNIQTGLTIKETKESIKKLNRNIFS